MERADATDELVELEDLSSARTADVVRSFNREVEELLSAEAARHYERLREYACAPRVVSAALLREGVALLYKGLEDEVVLLRRDGGRAVLLKPRESEVFTSLSRVKGSNDWIAVRASIEGSDEGRTYIIDAGTGGILHTIEGVAHDFCSVGGSLVYVRSYRRVPPPDGGERPTDRLVTLEDGRERVVWGCGALGAGEYIGYVAPSPDCRMLALTVHRGWARSKLYLLNAGSWEGELVEEGDYQIELAGWLGSELAYVRARPEGDELHIGGASIRLERPVQAALASGSRLLLIDLIDARHRVRINCGEAGSWVEVELPVEPVSVVSLDAMDGRFLIVATGFSHRHLVALIDGGVRVLEESAAVQGLLVEDIWLRSGGVRVHGFLVTKGGRPKAILLYGYGGFGVSLAPAYSAFFHHLLELGYAIAVVNARGGREEGEQWHRAGMLEAKLNTFQDFAAFARFFKSLGFKVAGYGSSNGGLTVAVVATRWPELLDAALVGYPVLDMLRYHLLYVGRYWIPEYGDPDDPKMREVLLSYSPYHNIPRGKRMPPTLLFTGFNDDRVHPAHAIKFAVKARQLGHPVYLRVETRSGHSGARTEIRALEAAYLTAFLERFLA
ncbi:MAG: prolyl oligopeptidase family serine peptidase [Thermofilaceae archaeon]